MDQFFSNEFYLDDLVKNEPMTVDTAMGSGLTSASVPIPPRKQQDSRGFSLDFGQPSPFQDNVLTGSSLYSSSSPWSPKDIKMEDDDIFQVDKSDLIQEGPTLAELNAKDETLLDDLNFDDLLLPDDSIFSSVPPPPQPLSNVALSFPPDGAFHRDLTLNTNLNPSNQTVPDLSPVSHDSSNSSLVQSISPRGGLSPVQQKHTTLQQLLLKGNVEQACGFGRSVPGRIPGGKRGPTTSSPYSHSLPSTSRLSSSAPTHLGMEQIWARREPRPHLLSTGSLAEATSTSSLSTGGVLSPETFDFSLDEGFDSEDDSDHYEDYSSDGDSGSDGEASNAKSMKKEKYFWQYNVQAKGPKGQRLVLKTKQEDPHFLDEVTDPVFSPQCSVQGIKHSGKARKGDGNDLTPNPRKLNAIGKELDKLGRIINDMTPVSELPFNARPKTRKEKNKLASRACRLKKKAQHEANKIKLYGLESEHKRLMSGISQMKMMLVNRAALDSPIDPQESVKMIEKVVKSATKVKIAGQSTEFVNKILEKVKGGAPMGGLDEIH